MDVSKWLEKPKALKAELVRLRQRTKTLLQKWNMGKGGSDNVRINMLLSEIDNLSRLLDDTGEEVPISEDMINKFRELYSKAKELEGQCKEGLSL